MTHFQALARPVLARSRRNWPPSRTSDLPPEPDIKVVVSARRSCHSHQLPWRELPGVSRGERGGFVRLAEMSDDEGVDRGGVGEWQHVASPRDYVQRSFRQQVD